MKRFAALLIALQISVTGAVADVLRGDPGQLSRGLQVYNEICAACHGMGLVRFRDLADPGGPLASTAQVRALADFYEIELDTPDGDTVFVAATPGDFFPENPAVGAPDFSLLALGVGKRNVPLSQIFGDSQAWRADPEAVTPWWLDAIARLQTRLLKGAVSDPAVIEAGLLGYTGAEREVAGQFEYENTAYAGGWASKAPPIFGEDVEYADGTAATAEQVSADVAAFMVWAATPKVQSRQKMLVHVVLLSATLLTLLVLTRSRLW